MKAKQPWRSSRFRTLCVAGSIALLSVAGIAAAGPVLTLNSTRASAGSTATLTLAIDGGTPDYAGLQVMIALPEGVTWVGSTADPGLSDVAIVSSAYEDAGAQFASAIVYANTDTFGDDGPLLQIELAIDVDAAPGLKTITITQSVLSDFRGRELFLHATTKGFVTVVSSAEPVLALGSVSAPPSGTAVVPLTLTGGDQEFTALHLVLDIPNDLSFAGAAVEAAMPGFTVVSNAYMDGTNQLAGIIAFSGTNTYGADGALLRLEFAVDPFAVLGPKTVSVQQSGVIDISGLVMIAHSSSDGLVTVGEGRPEGEGEGGVEGLGEGEGIGEGPGTALRYDGIDDFLDMGKPASIFDMPSGTFEMWYMPESDVSASLFERNIVGSDSPGDWWIATRPGGRVTVGITNNGGAVTSLLSDAGVLTLGVWSHIALTWDSLSGAVRMFVDGVLQQEMPDTFSGSTMTADTNILIGTNATAAAFLAGIVDEVRMWNVARAQSDIQASMNVVVAVDEPGLVAYWRFDEGTGTQSADLTVNTADALLGGGVAAAEPQWVISTAPIGAAAGEGTGEGEGEGIAPSANQIGGTVRDEDSSQPIVGATVTIDPGFRSQRTNELGEFLFADLPDGSYTISIFAAGFEAASANFTVSGGQDFPVLFDLTPIVGPGPGEGGGDGSGEGGPGGEGLLRLSGTVADRVTGDPVTCATVVATGATGDPIVVSTDLSGVFVFDGIAVEPYVIGAFAPGFQPNVVFVDPLRGGDLPLDFGMDSRPPFGLIFGVVKSEGNDQEEAQPLAGVKVSVFVGGVLFDTTFSCASGNFEVAVPGTKGANVTLEFEAEGFELDSIEDPPETVAVELIPKISVSGFIVGAVLDATRDEPVAGANVWVGLKGQTVLSFPRVTGDEGVYVVGNLGSGEYEIKVQAAGFEPETKTATKSNDALGLTVDFAITPSEQVVDGEGMVCAALASPSGMSAFGAASGDLSCLAFIAMLLIGRGLRRPGRTPSSRSSAPSSAP